MSIHIDSALIQSWLRDWCSEMADAERYAAEKQWPQVGQCVARAGQERVRIATSMEGMEKKLLKALGPELPLIGGSE